MTIYLWIYALCIFFSFIKDKKKGGVIALLIIVAMAAICLLRGEDVGSDTIHYLDIYRSDVAMEHYKNEFAFYNIVQYAISIGLDEVGCQIIIAILFYAPFALLIVRKSSWPTLSVLIFLVSTNRYFFETFNISRQMVSVCLALWSWVLFYENKKAISLGLYALACGFHMSTIFSLPVALLCYKRNFSYRGIYLSLSLSLVWTFLFSNPALVSGLLYYLNSFSFLGIDKYVYLDGYRMEMNRTIIGLLTLVGPHVFLCLLLVKKARTNFLVKLYYCGVIMLNLVAVLPISYRFALCLTALEILLLPDLLSNNTLIEDTSDLQNVDANNIRLNNLLIYAYILVLISYSLYIFLLPSSIAEYVPYKSIL